MVDVSIIIVSYNTIDFTVQCLRSVIDQTKGISYEIIVFDNNSSDNSAITISKLFPGIRLIKCDKNFGFAKANNIASQEAKGKYILLLNPDTIILNGAIQNLFFFALNNPFNRLYGGRTLYNDLSLNPYSCWKKPTLWSLFCYAFGISSVLKNKVLFDSEAYGGWQRNYPAEVDIIAGCFMLIERELWDQLCGFDLQFFMYGEDADFCLRAIKNGAKPIITPDAMIIHYGGASEKVRVDKMIRLFRAKGQLIRRHWPPALVPLGLILFDIAVITRKIAYVCSTFFGKRHLLPTARNWNQIWSRRNEW